MKKKRFTQHHFSTKNGAGLTLIEILVVLFIMGFIATSLYYVLNAGIKSWRAGKERTDIIAQARVAMDRLTRELRATGGIEAAEDTYIYFSTDLNADGTETHIYYSWPGSGISLLRKEAAGTYYSIARSINNFSFTYYSTEDDLSKIHELNPPDHTNTQPERNRIWMIEIKLKVKEDDNTVDLRSTVQPRNYSYTD
ncbi:prepilin-type N-terminal cleavage/methylation domain-containing protein [bacterium]|nr:prepilin-type N-terminal cleavage/methylation domain-containing protein [bacterium]